MGEIYDRMKGDNNSVLVTADMINTVLKDKKYLESLIEKWFAKEFFKIEKGELTEPLSGQNIIIAHVLQEYIEQTLKKDRENTPFEYLDTELKINDITLPLSNGLNVNFKAFIDRLDSKGDIIRIIDYKTGSDDLEINSIEALFDSTIDAKHVHTKGIFQVLLYCWLYRIKYPEEKRILQPGIYKVRTLFKDFSPYIAIDKKIVGSYDDVAEEYTTAIDGCLTELFDESVPFVQTTDENHCTYCDFKAICKR